MSAWVSLVSLTDEAVRSGSNIASRNNCYLVILSLQWRGIVEDRTENTSTSIWAEGHSRGLFLVRRHPFPLEYTLCLSACYKSRSSAEGSPLGFDFEV